MERGTIVFWAVYKKNGPDPNTLNYNSSKFNSLTCPDIDDIPEGDISNFFNGIDPDMNYQNNTNIKVVFCCLGV